ncbi:ribonuclease T2 family protein [Candidatus Methylobacter oryzae]|uniref:Ribonuclease T(2) n=1 Tax=Candidatus Methylobacter oryzae TaxID=2497749 RepID=A0ABY3CC11_9GAMM|nr:ribonuclease T2 [Candidatus Methylobacter oryzae]TRW97200.1 ribonuclease T(2) [Candidatus Methylobacter oryzae]
MSDIKTAVKAAALALAVGSSLSAQADGQPGKFDYYLLTLSWSPEHCAKAKNDKLQCGDGAHYGFVVHGLWPQYDKGYPDSCSMTPAVPKAVVQEMLPVMPSEKLIQHEWEKHGTCSGETVGNYFGLIKNTFQTIKIPDAFVNPSRPVNTSAADIRQAFLNSNPNLQMAVACKGQYLQEVRLCFDKQMHSTACSSYVKDYCSSSNVIVRPVH